MRRVAVAVVVVVAVAIVIFKTRSHSSTPTSQPHGGGSAAKQIVHGVAFDAPARKVAGTVYLEDKVAPGATVRLVKGIVEHATQTDAQGHFEFANVASDRYSVVAEVAHATGASLALDLANPSVDPEALRLVAHACIASLHGVVRDVSGGVIAKARVNVATDRAMGPGVYAGDDGSYELCVPVGDAGVMVSADGYADGFTSINIYGRVVRDFALMPEAVVAGRAVREGDGAPVEGAEVTLAVEDFRAARGRMPFVSTTSDADGRFRFRGVAPGNYALAATGDHLATRDSVQVTAEVATPVEDAEVTLAPALMVSGHAVDKQKKPVANASIVMRNTDDSVGVQLRFRSQRTRPDGSFVFENLPPGEYRVGSFVDGPRSSGTDLELDKTDVTGVTIEVDALGTISGRVTRAGQPVEGSPVTAQSGQEERFGFAATATSDADGKFEITGVRPGDYHIYAESKRLGAFTQGPQVTVHEGEAVKGVEVELELAGSIAGVVVDQAGAPVAGADVRFSLGDRDYGQATTADDGTFKAGALSGGGDYEVQVRPNADTTASYRPASGTKFPVVNVKDGSTAVTGVRIQIQYDRLQISGRVVTSDGKPAPDVAVSAERRMARGWAPPVVITDETGGFTFKDLTAGKYYLVARSTKGTRAIDNVVAGTKNVEIKLPVLGEIKGTLEGFSRAPTISALPTDPELMMQQYRGTVTGTTFVIKNLPVGQYVVSASSTDGYAQGEITVEAKPASLTLKNPGVGAVEGTVVDETTREPIDEIYCRASRNGFARSDHGAFKLTRVPAGTAEVKCMSQQYEGTAAVTVEIGKTAHVDLFAKKRTIDRGYAGLEIEVRSDDLLVKSATGPAERAGIKVGDALTKVRDRDVGSMFGANNVVRMIEAGPVGSTVKLTLERDNKERTVELTLEARPK